MADVGLNQQTLNIYDLIRIQEDNFRALGRAFFSGRPAPSPPQYAELSYTNLTNSERKMVDAMDAKLDRAGLEGRATALEVSHIARMCCDLGHFCQGLAQKNVLTDGTAVEANLNNINNNAGNIETASRKIMCLVDSRKDRVCWPTEVKVQLNTTQGLINAIKADLDQALQTSREGHFGMTELPELIGFGQMAEVHPKGKAIQNAIDLANELVKLNNKAVAKHPFSIVPADTVTPSTIKCFRDNFENYVEAADPATATNKDSNGNDIFEIARVNIMHHRVFNRKDLTVMPYALFRKVTEKVTTDSGHEVDVVKLHNLGRGSKEHVTPTYRSGYDQGFQDATANTPYDSKIKIGGAVEIWAGMNSTNGISSQQRQQQKGTLWQEVKWPIETGKRSTGKTDEGALYSYMTHYGSWLTCAQEGDWKCKSGLVYEGQAFEERDEQAGLFKIEEENANASQEAQTRKCHHCGHKPDTAEHHLGAHGHDDGRR